MTQGRKRSFAKNVKRTPFRSKRVRRSRSSSRSMPRSIKSMVKVAIKGLAESKTFDHNEVNSTGSQTVGYFRDLYHGVVQGTNSANRIGLKISPSRLALKVKISNSVNQMVPVKWRFIIFKFMESETLHVPVMDDILQTTLAGFQASDPWLKTYRKRPLYQFKIIYDRKGVTHPTILMNGSNAFSDPNKTLNAYQEVGNRYLFINLTSKQMGEIGYETGTGVQSTRGGVFTMFVCDRTTNLPSVDLQYRAHFTDV